jgi:hypothetical protein
MTRPDLLRDILEESLDTLGLRERLRALRALLSWKEVVGETVAAAAQPEALKEGKVFVAVKSNAWIQELRFQQQTILQRLNEYAGAPIFTELVFRVRPRSRSVQTEHAAPQEPPTAEPEVDAATMARLHALTDPIADAELRAKVTELLVGYYRLLHMRKQRGWQECARCGCLHPHEGSECLFCCGELT